MGKGRVSLTKLPSKWYLLIWFVDLEMDGCGGLGESWPAGTVTPARLSHGWWRGARQRAGNEAYGPRFDEPTAPRERRAR
jgi:hypothetical protein